MKRFNYRKIPAVALLSLGLSQSVFAGSARNFYDYTPQAATINGERFPRNQQTLFRGTGDGQMDFSKAVSAMLGDNNANIESLFFSTIKYELMAKPFAVAVELNSFLHQQIQKLIQQNGGPLDTSAAVAATRKLIDGTFAYYDQNNTAISTSVDYRSGSYVDWPNDIIFSTILSPVAGTYGDRVLVLNEQKPHSLDLNFWNYVHNNTWYDHTRDIGEFISFAYTPAEDLTGYQVRQGSSKSWHYIQFAAYRSADRNSKALLLFNGIKKDGNLSTCIDLNKSENAYYHCDYQAGEIVESRPALTNEKVQLAGIISLCASDDDASCSRPSDKELQKYSKAGFPSELVQRIQASLKTLKFKNQRVKFLSLSK
jgi:hypothetical protein